MRSRSLLALTCSSWLVLMAAGTRAEAPGGQGASRLGHELARLRGHRVQPAPDGYVIEDVAGEGKPLVGVIERRGDALWLVAKGGAYRLAGVLARPRIAGPGYKVWALGAVSLHADERVLVVRRIGVLAPPWRRAGQPTQPSSGMDSLPGIEATRGRGPALDQARAERSTIRAISAGAPTRTGGPQ